VDEKVKDFRSRWLFIDVLEDSDLFLIIGEPPAKCTTWASEALLEEVLKALRPQIRDLRHESITGPMVGVEFITRRRCMTTIAQSGRTETVMTFGSMPVSLTQTSEAR
jgi:hypothetical protein